MINYNLEATIIPPLSKEQPKQAIILCHGYGGDGKDISNLAINWQRFLPDAIFLCPNAPEPCNVNPQGYQWFDLTSDNEEIIYEKSLSAEKKLNTFLDQVYNNFQIEADRSALVGFSQGCMMAIQVGLTKKEKINSVIGYSGKVINQKYLSKNINSKPNIFLMHGAKDTIVSPLHLLEAKEYLINKGIKLKTKLFNDCEHHIPVDGVSLGLKFLKKNLLSE
jgi:phospholipase/carboxylesterase